MHASPSAQLVPSARIASAGHDTPVPPHVSATSHAPVLARHTVPAGASASAGQLVVPGAQRSATSHAPVAVRHTIVLATAAESGPHVPSTAAPAVALHAWQSSAPPPHGVSQQRLSTQWLEPHSAPLAQTAPFSLRRRASRSGCPRRRTPLSRTLACGYKSAVDMRRRTALVAAAAVVLAGAALGAAHLSLLVAQRVVLPDDRPRDLADGTRLELVGLRGSPLLPWLPRRELRAHAPSGELAWALPLSEGDATSTWDVRPTDELFLVQGPRVMRALARRDGEALWRRDDGLPPLSSALVLGTRVLAVSEGAVHALDRDSGRTLWSLRDERVRGRARPFGADRITVGELVLDVATGARRPPLDGYDCRTDHEVLTCDDARGCVRHRADGRETVLSVRALGSPRDCYARDGLLVVDLDLSARAADDLAPPRPSRAIASWGDLAPSDRRALVAWDADDRLAWAWASPAEPDDTCLLADGRLKLPEAPTRVDRRPAVRYFDLATGTSDRCVGLDDCPGTITEPWHLDMQLELGERACRPTGALVVDE